MSRAAVVLLVAVLTPGMAAATRGKRNELLRVVTPGSKSTVPAHPFVNIIVKFGRAGNAPADPATFRARLGGTDITPLFEPLIENGVDVGRRAAVDQPLVHVGRKMNRLRLEVRAQKAKRGHAARDVDKVRFHAVEAPNQPPVARLLPGTDVVLNSIPIQFSATSEDPELDELHYDWDFGDGETSTEQSPTHTYQTDKTDVTVGLTVSDGAASAHDEETLVACPSLDPDRTPGVLRVESTDRPEFNAVLPGTSASHVLTVHNTSTTPTSQLRVHLALKGDGFGIDATELNLGPDEQSPVTLTFAPTVAGHQTSELVIAASASNRCAVHLVAHGFGGDAPGTGPTLAGEPVFYTDSGVGVPGTGTFAMFPSGARAYIDNTTHLCVSPQNGAGTGDVCLTDHDCINGGVCAQTSNCIRGERDGQPCSVLADCPGGFCPSQADFEPLDMCSDGQGNLFLLSDEGTFTDVTPTETELSGTLLRLSFDPATGVRTGADILNRTTTQTEWLACDRLPTGTGRVYLPEFHEINAGASCFRDGQESLTAVRKTTGVKSIVPGMERIDVVEGLDRCSDDYDESQTLHVSADSSTAFASLTYGLYRLLPTPLFVSPDVTDYFQLHPDGSVIVVRTSDTGPLGLVSIYKIDPNLALTGAVRLSEMTPCATVKIPNNRTPGSPGTSTIINAPYAVGHAATGGPNDAVVLVGFVTVAGAGRDAVLSSNLRVQGTLAFSSPADSNTCTFLGYINLDVPELLTF
jgi:PKD repeat protein